MNSFPPWTIYFQPFSSSYFSPWIPYQSSFPTQTERALNNMTEHSSIPKHNSHVIFQCYFLWHSITKQTKHTHLRMVKKSSSHYKHSQILHPDDKIQNIKAFRASQNFISHSSVKRQWLLFSRSPALSRIQASYLQPR